MEKPQFSCVLIARNEETTLPRLLKSLEEFKARGGEVCILDTGSTDKTVQIARDWGCKVEEVNTKYLHTIDSTLARQINKRFMVDGETPVVKEGDKYFDFASARNHSTKLCSNNWVCTIDADEELTKLDIDAINKVIADPNLAHLEYEFVFSHDQWGNPAIQFVQSKMFDRRKIEWQNIVHEIITPINGGGHRAYLPPEIFKLEHWQQPGDRHSYLIGLAVDCFYHQSSDRNSHYFARELMWSGRPKSAIKEFERHINMGGWLQERSESMAYIGDCYGKLGKPEEQAKWYNRSFFTDNSKRSPLIRMAMLYKHANNPQAAACFAKAAMEIPWSSFYANDYTHYTVVPHEILYWAYGWLGKIPEAQEHLLKCLEYQPYNQMYLRDTKYYFGYADKGIEGWMRFPELNWLYNTAKTVNSIAEIGSWKGRSTHALLSGCKGTVTAIDHFMGSSDVKDGTHGIQDDSVFEQFKKNTAGVGHLEVNRKSSLEAAKDYEGKSFDMVFIDAGHTYDEVVADIRAWKDKARFVLSGHDYAKEWPEVMKAVNDELGEVQVCDSIWYKFMNPTVTFVLPTLGRPEGLERCLKSIREIDYPQDLIETIVLDGDGTVSQKVAAGLDQSTGQYIVYASNDTEFTRDSLKEAIKASKENNKALVAFNTGDILPDEGNICEHFLIRKDFIPQIDGEIFDTEFHHVGVDNLLWAKCKALDQAYRCQSAVVNHYHFTKGAKMDEVYNKGWSKVQEDRELLKKKLALIKTPSVIVDMKNKIINGVNFSFIKRGDGEEACMNGETGANCDGHNYSRALGDKLKESYEFFSTRPECKVVAFDDQKIYNTLLHRTDNNINEVKDLYLSIRESNRNKVFIGPGRLKEVSKILKAKHVVIPELNMFESLGDVFAQAMIDATKKDTIFIIAGGMPAKPLIKQLLTINRDITCLDIGSSFDPLIHQSRTYQITTEDIRKLYEDCLR